MKLFVLTQHDVLYIPRLLNRFFAELAEKVPGSRISGIAITPGEVSQQKLGKYVTHFGVISMLKMGCVFVAARFVDRCGRLVGHGSVYSVKGIAERWHIPVHEPLNVNSPDFLDLLRSENVDIVISVACPQIIKQNLLQLPRLGCINVHGALLPRYRGRVPSFWVLANGESETGVTVHYINEKLDDGLILVQKKVPIMPADTLHSLILRSKVNYGAVALAEAVLKLGSGDTSTLPNDSAQATYFSAPTRDAVRAFMQRGRRVI